MISSACESTAPFEPPTPTFDGGIIVDVGTSTIPDAGFVVPDAGWPDPDPGLSPCSPALELTPPQKTVPITLRTLRAQGGTGQYTFSLEANASGAVINPDTGAYLSGELAGTQDIVRLRDMGCIGTTTTTVDVLIPMIVEPATAEIEPLIDFTILPTRGSGTYRFDLLRAPSRGSVQSDGRYTAGPADGADCNPSCEDIIRVTDEETEQTADVRVTVSPGSDVRAVPSEIHVPVGSSYRLDIRGGTGRYMITSDTPGVELVDGVVTSNVPGTTLFTIEDEFTFQVGEATITFVEPQTVTATRSGDRSFTGAMLGPGDIDGDGFEDAVLGLAEADVTGHNAGAVYVFRGTPTGLRRVPSWTVGGISRGDAFGTAIAVADFDGDGEMDLAVGAPNADVSAVDSGGVFIFGGIANGLFETVPRRTLGGRGPADRFGEALAACDFDADSRTDLAVGAPFAEDRGLRQVRVDQGAAFIFLNNPGLGFQTTPDQSVYGALPRMDGRYLGETNLRLGSALAAGDIDGDGACDLAVSSVTYSGNAGLVYVYPGVDVAMTGAGGVSDRPHLAYVGATMGANLQGALGRSLAIGDITGDQRAELAISHHRHDGMAGADSGATRVILGRPFSAKPTFVLTPIANADATYQGANAGDQAGWQVTIGDANGDNVGDLITSSLLGEVATGTASAGSIAIYTGRQGPLPGGNNPLVYGGLLAGDGFGVAFAPIGDVDNDRNPDFAVLAGQADLYGPDVGVPYFVSGDTNRAFDTLALVGRPAGDQLGHGADIVGDIDDDGNNDMVVGAPRATLRGRGLNSGAAYVYFGTPSGFSTEPDLEINDVRGLSSQDGFGAVVQRAGDFDGDGIADFVVSAPGEDSPAAYTGYFPENGCRATARTNSGAIYVFRGRRNLPPSTTPAFVYWGDQTNGMVSRVAGGFDINNDGRDDLLLGVPDHDRAGNRQNSGRFIVLHGRAANEMGTTVICRPDVSFRGLNANDRLGESVAALGDLDGDGCDEVGIGAPNESLGVPGQGVVRVLFGAGNGCSAVSSIVALVSGQANAEGGFSLAGGFDVDGDTINDVAVGGPGAVVNGEAVGAVWIIRGEFVLDAAATTVRDDIPPGSTQPFVDPADIRPGERPPNFRVEGSTSGGRFGHSVALLAGASGAGNAGLVVGSPQGTFSRVPLSGGVFVYRVNRAEGVRFPRGIVPEPIVSVPGETNRPGGAMGFTIATGDVSGFESILVSGIRNSGVSVDLGATYVISPQPR